MDQRNQCRELHSKCMIEEKEIKKKFTKVVKFINNNNLNLSIDCKGNIKDLIKKWNKKDKYYKIILIWKITIHI